MRYAQVCDLHNLELVKNAAIAIQEHKTVFN